VKVSSPEHSPYSTSTSTSSSTQLPKTTPNQSSDELWKHAYELAGLELTVKEYALLQAKSVDGDPIYRSVIEDAILAQSKRRRNQRTKFHKIIKGLDTYARIVDVAIQHSPEVTALAWAGARFLLLVHGPMVSGSWIANA
jgi:hypothetical protein